MSDKTHVHDSGESYSGIVPAKPSNKSGGPPAETRTLDFQAFLCLKPMGGTPCVKSSIGNYVRRPACEMRNELGPSSMACAWNLAW